MLNKENENRSKNNTAGREAKRCFRERQAKRNSNKKKKQRLMIKLVRVLSLPSSVGRREANGVRSSLKRYPPSQILMCEDSSVRTEGLLHLF